MEREGHGTASYPSPTPFGPNKTAKDGATLWSRAVLFSVVRRGGGMCWPPVDLPLRKPTTNNNTTQKRPWQRCVRFALLFVFSWLRGRVVNGRGLSFKVLQKDNPFFGPLVSLWLWVRGASFLPFSAFSSFSFYTLSHCLLLVPLSNLSLQPLSLPHPLFQQLFFWPHQP